MPFFLRKKSRIYREKIKKITLHYELAGVNYS